MPLPANNLIWDRGDPFWKQSIYGKQSSINAKELPRIRGRRQRTDPDRGAEVPSRQRPQEAEEKRKAQILNIFESVLQKIRGYLRNLTNRLSICDAVDRVLFILVVQSLPPQDIF